MAEESITIEEQEACKIDGTRMADDAIKRIVDEGKLGQGTLEIIRDCHSGRSTSYGGDDPSFGSLFRKEIWPRSAVVRTEEEENAKVQDLGGEATRYHHQEFIGRWGLVAVLAALLVPRRKIWYALIPATGILFGFHVI